MIKSKVRIIASAGVLALAAFATAGTAQAQSWSERKEDNTSGPGFNLPSNCRSGFVSYYSTGMRNNNSTLFTDLACDTSQTSGRGRIRARWNGDSNFDDYVVGLGWPATSTNKSRSITYNTMTFNPSATDTSASTRVATMGVYGWLCPTTSGQEMVEYYVVDSWYGSSSFVPYDTTLRKPGKINNVDYDFYSSNLVTRGQGCTDGAATFRQLWAVRKTKKTTGSRTIKMADFFSAWNGVSGVNTSAPAGYQIVSVEGIGGTKGTLDVQVN